MKEVPPRPGVYLLVIRIRETIREKIGSLGLVELKPGIYVYVGSARGPGGLRARIHRHLTRNKKKHWHIDYILTHPEAQVISVIYTETQEDLEEKLAKICLDTLAPALKGFGATDRRSKTHLLICRDEENICIEKAINCIKELK